MGAEPYQGDSCPDAPPEQACRIQTKLVRFSLTKSVETFRKTIRAQSEAVSGPDLAAGEFFIILKIFSFSKQLLFLSQSRAVLIRKHAQAWISLGSFCAFPSHHFSRSMT
jgi:hypothetical protein